MDLEPLVTKLEIDARQYMNALDQVERGLTGLDRTSTAATDRMGAGFRRAGAEAQQSAARVSAATRQMGQAYGNVANQIADFAVQVQAGQNPVRALTQQLSQSLVFFGPWGAALGAAAAVAGGLTTAFFGMGDSADEAGEGVQGLIDRLDALSTKGVTDVDALVKKFSELSPAMQGLASIEVGVNLAKLHEDLSTAEGDLLQFIAQVRSELAPTSLEMSFLEGGVPLAGLEADPVIVELQRLFGEFQKGRIDVEQLIETLDKYRARVGDGSAAGPMIEQMLAMAIAAQRLREEVGRAEKAMARLMTEPEAGLRMLQQRASSRAALVQTSYGLSPDEPKTKATFEDVIGPMRERLELLEQTELTESQISAILGAQARLKRDLSDIEREALIEVGAALDVAKELHALEERRTKASEGLTTSLGEQRDKALLLVQFGGQESDEYKLQLALLNAKKTAMGELTQEQRLLVTAARAATERAERDVRMTELRRRTRQMEFEGDPRRAAEAGISDITGLPASRGFYAQQERFRQRQAKPFMTEMERVNMEPLIQQMAAAQQHLVLMTDTAPKLASTLTDLSKIAISEGFEEAGTQMLGMMAEMIFQAIVLQTIMAAIGMLAPNPIKPMATTPGGVPIYGLQHGGRARKGEPVIVGEAGPELFVPDAAGQVHSTPDTTAMMGGGGGRGAPGGGGGVKVDARPEIHIHTPPNTETRTEEQPGGGEEGGGRIDIMIDEMVAGNMRPGTATSRAMQARFGLKYQTRS